MRHSWENSYPPGLSWGDALPPPVPLHSFLDVTAEKWPEKISIDFYGATVSYAALRDLSARAAKGLQELGVGPGVHVGLHLPNTPHYIICFFAVLMAGGRVVNFSPLAGARELKNQLLDSETRLMITLGVPMLYPQIAALSGTGRFDTLVVCSLDDFLPAAVARSFAGPAVERVPGPGREIDFAGLITNDGKFVRHPLGDLSEEIAVIAYTGGTTGEPKGAMLTHANFSAVAHIRFRWGAGHYVEGKEKNLVILPISHIFALSGVILLSVVGGEAMVLHLRFDPNRILEDVPGKKITTFSAVPTMYAALINHSKIAETDFSSLRHCGSGGAPLPAEIAGRFKDLTGLVPIEGYGLTETASLGTCQLLDVEPRRSSVGLPLPHTLIEVVDIETGEKILPDGEYGEICITGPQVMKGYWKRPEATSTAFRGGRFHTGDIGFIDPDGYVSLIDRKKDMIISGGYNVFPRTIEEAMYEHPAIAEVTVIGVPDGAVGQFAKAFIKLKPDCSSFTYRELREFLADKLATYEIPIEMEFRENLPKTPAGKLSRKELVAEELAKRGLATV